MRLLRAVSVIAVLLGFAAPTEAVADPLETCAQRVIRDWYSGGRVDRTYPLACYRAAIRALPEDVRQYSNADRDIARALAYARRGRVDPGVAHAATDDPTPPPALRADARSERRAAVPRPRPGGRAAERDDLSTRIAAGPERAAVSGSLPYPVIVLAVLSVVLLLTGGLRWLAARRR